MKPRQYIFRPIPRRLFVHGAFAGACSSLLSAKVSCAFQNKTAGKQSAGSALDQALDLLAAAPQGSSTHAPMVAEALAALGHADAAVAWIERNKRENERPYPAASRPLKREDWHAALGDQSRRGEWVVFFQREIAETGWQSVLREWVAQLAPGMAAAAAHGLIRTAHAVRGLEASHSAQRQRELAEGLGYWASWYQKLPAAPAWERGTLKPAEALKQITPMPPEQVRRGNIVAAVSSLEDFPPFAPTINWVDASGDAARFLSDLTETFVHAYLANANNFNSTLRLVHAMT
ncbi:MAG: questin oxidase family protein, partial [Burkholderiales bacterium]